MRLDIIEYWVKDEKKAEKFFKDTLGYSNPEKNINTSICEKLTPVSKIICLDPPEKLDDRMPLKFGVQVVEETPNEYKDMIDQGRGRKQTNVFPVCNYHLAPKIFIKYGEEVEKWVKERNNIGGIKSLTYQVESVDKTVEEWKNKGYAEFCEEDGDFATTKPSEITGVVYRFVNRD